MAEKHSRTQNIDVEHDHHWIIVSLRGYIDAQLSARLAAALRPLYFHRTVIIIDLSDVKGIVSAGIKTIFEIYSNNYRNAEVMLCDSSGNTMFVIEMTGLHRLFATHFSLGAAKAAAEIEHRKLMN